MRLGRFGIMVNNMATMARFYHDVPGLEIREEENTINVYLEKDSTLLLIYQESDVEKMAGRKFLIGSLEGGEYHGVK